MSVEEIIDSILNYMDEIIEAIDDDSTLEDDIDILTAFGY